MSQIESVFERKNLNVNKLRVLTRIEIRGLGGDVCDCTTKFCCISVDFVTFLLLRLQDFKKGARAIDCITTEFQNESDSRVYLLIKNLSKRKIWSFDTWVRE